MLARPRHRGFSLIELLVVIVIIGIVSSVAVMSLGLLGDDRELQTEARRFISLIEVAQDEAMMQGREFGLELMTGGYRFVEYDPFANQWTELLGDDTFRLRQLPEEAEFELFLEDKRIVLEPEPAETQTSGDGANRGPRKAYAPHVLIFSSGDSTPFELHIARGIEAQTVVVRNDPSGVLEIVSDDE